MKICSLHDVVLLYTVCLQMSFVRVPLLNGTILFLIEGRCVLLFLSSVTLKNACTRIAAERSWKGVL